MIDRRSPRLGRVRLFALLAFGLSAAACGDLTAGGVGQASVHMSGDAPDSSPSQSPSAYEPQPASSPASTNHDEDDPEGEVEVEFQLFLVAEDGDLVPLTDSDVRVRVDLDGVEEPEVVNRLVAAARYVGLRMVFSEIEAEIDAGLVIGGVPIIGPVDVEIDGALTVTRPIELVIESDGRADILIDLNAASWLQAVDPITLLVDAQVFADLVAVVVR